MPTHYIMLVFAIITETIGTTALQASEQFSRFWPSVIVVVSYSASFYLMALALKIIPVGIAYAIWSGLGIVFIASAIQGAIMYLGDLGGGLVGLLGRAILFFGGICIAAPDGFAGFHLAELTLVGVVCVAVGLGLGKLGSKKPGLA